MKKFGKIFALLLALCVLVGVFIVVASADGEKNTTSPFIVDGKYYDKYTAAVSAARYAKDEAIYLNPNYIDESIGTPGVIEISPTYDSSNAAEATQFYAWSGSVTLDLNGCTIRVADGNTNQLIATSGSAVFTLRGEGTIDNLHYLSYSAGSTFNMIGSGKGITLNLRKYESETVNTHSLINACNQAIIASGGNNVGGSINISGRITVNPYNVHTKNIFSIGGAAAFNADGATFIINSPKSELQKNEIWNDSLKDKNGNPAPDYEKTGAGTMFSIGAGCKASFNNSHFEYNHGNMFATGGSGTIIEFQQKDDGTVNTTTYADPSTMSAKDPTLFIDADNSTFIANEGCYINRTDYSLANNYYAAGAILTTGSSGVYATFDNCEFVGAHRAFTASSGKRSTIGTKSYVMPCHVIMNDCNYRTSDDILQTSPWLVGDSINIKWNGGTIILKAPTITQDGTTGNVKTITVSDYSGLLSYTHAYNKLVSNNNDYDDDWFGVSFNNVLFGRKPSDPTVSANYTPVGAIKTANIKFYTNGDANYAYTLGYWVGDKECDIATGLPAYYGLAGVVASKTTSFDATHNFRGFKYSSNGNYSLGMSIGAPSRSGNFERVNREGNGYVRFIYDDLTENPKGSGGYPYLDLNINSYATLSNSKPTSYDAFMKVTTTGNDDVFTSKYFVYEFDVSTSTGTYTATTLGAQNRSANVTYVPKKGDASAYYNIDRSASNSGVSYGTIERDGTLTTYGVSNKLPTDGSWSRISIIFEIGYKETTSVVIAGAPEGENTFEAYDFSSTLAHVFLNGKYVASGPAFGDKPVIKHLASTAAIDCVRAWFYPDSRFVSDVCFDNVHLSKYTDDNEMIADIIENKESLVGKEGFLIMPDNNGYAAVVDGKKYMEMSDALAAIRSGSTITLYEDVNEVINVTSPILINTNGHSIKGFASEGFVECSGDGYIGFKPASKNQIFEINMSDTVNSITETQTLTVGSTVVPSASADPDNYPNEIGGKYFVGWTFVEGEELIIVDAAYDTDADAKIAMLPVYVDPAIVEWYDNDNVLLDSESYKPGESVYSKVFKPENDLPGITTNHAWFDLKFTGYSAVALPKSGTYKVYPNMVGVEKDGTPDNIKLNLTLFTNNELNIFIPLDALSKYKDSIRIVKLDGETNTIAVGSAGECTVYGAPYIKFADVYGIADTTINTYRIYYNVGGAELSKDIKYGVPAYASQIMQTSNNEEAKTLVMNMVNYANAVIKNLNVDKTGDLGARVYTKLLELYPDYVRTYDDDEFLEGGTIYNNDVAKLTFDDVILNEDESISDKSPSKWIKSAGFFFSTNQPRFYIVFSEDAEATANGIKKPTSNGGYGWKEIGLFGYIGFEAEKCRPGRMYAIYDDTGLNAYADWNNKDKNGNISYYLVATKTDNQNDYKLYNMAESLRIELHSNSGLNSSADVTYPEQGDGVNATYSLAGYINGMLTAANAEGVSAEDKAEYLAGAEMAKALYAYAKVTREYVY